MGGQRFARLDVAGDDVQDARRQSRGLGDLADHEGLERRVRRAFENNRAARGQCRRDLAEVQEQREVERRDQGGDTEGLADHHTLTDAVADHRRQRGLELEAGEYAVDEVEEVVDRGADLQELRQRTGGSRFGDGEVHQLGAAVGETLGHPAQHRASLAHGHPRPRALVERSSCGADRVLDVGDSCLRHRPDHRLGRGVDHGDRLGAAAVDPFAVDEELPGTCALG